MFLVYSKSSTMLRFKRHMFSTTRTYLIQTTLNDQPVIPRVSSPVINATIITQWVIYIFPCSNETKTGTPAVYRLYIVGKDKTQLRQPLVLRYILYALVI